MKTITAYSDKISVCPGETIKFMVNCESAKSYDARLIKVRHGDINPAGPGYKERHVKAGFEGTYPGRKQQIHCGSYTIVPCHQELEALESFSVQAMVWPTTPTRGTQSILSHWDEGSRSGFILGLDNEGSLSLTLGDGKGGVATVSTDKPLLAREWYFIAASFNAADRQVHLYQVPQMQYAKTDDRAEVVKTVETVPRHANRAPFVMAAHVEREGNGRPLMAGHYNGKLDRPCLARRALSRLEMEQIRGDAIPQALADCLVAAWDFSRNITSERITDVSANRLHGETVNFPTRAVKGHNWTGEEMCWRHKPEHYGAIHFHDDDLYDAGWKVDFEYTVPHDLKSGLYAAHVAASDDEDFVPFIVRPERGTATSDLVFVIPTASYMAYGNEHNDTDASLAELVSDRIVVMQPTDVFLHEHREYGASLYDTHSDGSGVCYSSRLRPLLTMRPKYQSWLAGKGSALWQLSADTHIIDWLEEKGFSYDCIADEDLHNEGYQAIAHYRVFMSSTHHEYWSKQMWEAVDIFKKQGGRLIYMGANAWYWRIAYHKTKPGVIELRRAEGGVRPWTQEPGEYYHSFTGEYGGLWRRQGLPPQMVAGTGFTAQGFDVSSYYRRKNDSYNQRARFIFEGVDEEIIGDFGLIGGGAAGIEIDRADRGLGTPPNALVLASSEAHTSVYMVVPEEIQVNAPGMTDAEHELVRADLVFFETAAGGAVLATSSIAWAGSLSHNGYNNNISRITENVLKRFLDPERF